MSYLSIGSGDVGNLLSGKQTKGYADLWRKFLSDSAPYYNAFASPIDALRTGAILESAYSNYLSDDYFIQIKRTCPTMDVFTSSIDFGKFSGGNLVDFDELKTIFFPDYIELIKPICDLDEKEQIKVLKKKFKKNYQQVQFQLLCSGLESANLVFLSVESYEDQVNESRVIRDEDVTKFRIKRDPQVINFILERGDIFQKVKDNFK